MARYNSLFAYEADHPGMSKKSIAEEIGITPGRYSRIRMAPVRDNSAVRLNWLEVYALADLLGRSREWVVKTYNTASTLDPVVRANTDQF